MFEIYNVKNISDDYLSELNWSGLWIPVDQFEEAGIEDAYVIFDEEKDIPVGFISANIDGQVVAIEVRPDYQGRGLAFKLIEESGWYKPERDENPEFWAHVQEVFG